MRYNYGNMEKSIVTIDAMGTQTQRLPWGEYCKHEVAVLLAIRRLLEQGAMPKKHGQKQGLRSLLLRQTKNQLVSLLCELAVEYDLREDIFYLLEDGDD